MKSLTILTLILIFTSGYCHVDQLDNSYNIPWYQDPNWIMLLFQIVSILITLFAVYIAYISIMKQTQDSRDVAKKTKALDFVTNLDKIKNQINGLSVITKFQKKNICITNLVDFKKSKKEVDKLSTNEFEQYLKNHKEMSEDYLTLTIILNYYEYLAISIRKNIVCEEIIRNSAFSTIINLFECSNPLIIRMREIRGSKTLYTEYEWLYNRWMHEDVGYNGILPKLD